MPKGLKTLTSKNASCREFQKPFHLMLTRQSCWVFVKTPCSVSPVSGCSTDSVLVNTFTSSIREAVTSQMSLYLCMGRPPFMQLKACCTLFSFPQEHVLDNPLGCHPYLRARAALKAPL